jgi:two-component system cell cycle response regulator
VSEQESIHLVKRVEMASGNTSMSPIGTVPIIDKTVYLALASEGAQAIGESGAENIIMIVDAHTASQVEQLDDLCQVASTIVVFGDMPSNWAPNCKVFIHPFDDFLRTEDQVLLLASSSFCFGVLGTRTLEDAEMEEELIGGWTVHSEQVRHIGQTLLGDASHDMLRHIRTSETATTTMMRLMALHANALVTRQRSISKDKDDLSSVLDILKAISSKRRAHDVLFVFVEQIARVVNTERCSVVRVWGGDDCGHVLASHEDEKVSAHSIDLEKYPELRRSLSVRGKVVINNVRRNPLTQDHADLLKKANINALLVIPIVLFDENIGSLFLRAARSQGGFSQREVDYFEIVAEAAANALERAQLFESIQIANERLEHLAITDGLTGLYNHRHFRDRITEEFQRACRYKVPLSCMIFDVDDFKIFNDSFGHLSGDQILREISKRTLNSIRTIDFAARYGGEEFVIVMPQTDAAGARSQGERLRAAIADTVFSGVSSNPTITVSVGVSTLYHEKEVSCEDLIRTADEALYSAKRSGKNKVITSDIGKA